MSVIVIEEQNGAVSQYLAEWRKKGETVTDRGQARKRFDFSGIDAIVVNYDDMFHHGFVVLFALLDGVGCERPPIIGLTTSLDRELERKGKQFGVDYWIDEILRLDELVSNGKCPGAIETQVYRSSCRQSLLQTKVA